MTPIDKDPEQDRIRWLQSRGETATDAERTELAMYAAEGKTEQLAELPIRSPDRSLVRMYAAPISGAVLCAMAMVFGAPGFVIMFLAAFSLASFPGDEKPWVIEWSFTKEKS